MDDLDTRGDAEGIAAAVQGQQLDGQELLDHELAEGAVKAMLARD